MKTYIADKDSRTNPLSIEPGGSTLIVKFENHEVVYTNIKNPWAYIRKITNANPEIKSIFVDGQLKWPTQ